MAVAFVDILDSQNQAYDNTTSGLTANNVQSAIDELVATADFVGSGDVLQVKYAYYRPTNGAASVGDSLASVAITPKSTSSTIIVEAGIELFCSGTALENAVIGLKIDGTDQTSTYGTMFRSYTTGTDGHTIQVSGKLFIPNTTTTSKTFLAFVQAKTGSPEYRDKGLSYIQLMEIKN